ncbi:hypothetical protein [Bizionia psychrotolerans]|uniref:hypothetical protein n=1 Tax=Bizionia psychrotolerans TaxID=1492901 RepID=UPI000650A915|nr:hypothetical protein [Bizionia psychrotolerans]
MTKKVNKAKIFLTKMVEMLEDENTVLLSDNDLFYLVNSELSKKDRISMSYFEFLKSPNQANPRSISSNQSLTEDEKEEFISALRVGRIKQKMNLTKNALDNETKNAYPNLWILERKNTDLQLRQQVDINHNPVIQISAGNAETENIIKGLIGDGKPVEEVEFEEVEFEEVEFEKITKSEEDDN